MLYRWIRLYKEHRREWYGLLTTVEQDTLSSLLTLYKNADELRLRLHQLLYPYTVRRVTPECDTQKAAPRGIKQRITVHYTYQGLLDPESIDYIIHKLDCAGSSKAIIDDGALKAVAGQPRGNPRLIDNTMSDAIVIGAQQKKKCIDTDVILAAVNNQNLG